MAMVVLSASVLAVTYAVSAGQMQTYTALSDLRAMSLAEALMEEAVAQPFVPLGGSNALGPETGEVRSSFSSVDDFHNYQEAAGALASANGVLYPAAYQTYARSVSVAIQSVSVPGAGASVTGATVTVTVTATANNAQYQVQRFVR